MNAAVAVMSVLMLHTLSVTTKSETTHVNVKKATTETAVTHADNVSMPVECDVVPGDRGAVCSADEG